ncbi:toll-like receptor 4 [Liolophura sinensis]|uniref:toll-like receptor 4 n=1 Tax=Liolophura sinensis TaxID=3198878 RepID=UPI0031591C46
MQLHPAICESGYSDELPLGWENACVRTLDRVDWNPEPPSFNWSQPLVHISCRLTQGSLSLSDFRVWSNASDGRPIALDILCVNQMNSSISFPWPFKAPHLVSLEIVNCRTVDIFSEYLSDSIDTPQNIRILVMKDTVKTLSTSNIQDFVSNVTKISRDVHCLSVVLEKYVYTNVTTNYVIEPEHMAIVVELLNNWQIQMQRITHRCDFKYLQLMDESIGKGLDDRHFFQLHAKATFPELRVYNLSHLGYTEVPTEFRHWRLDFPKLERLDFSWNNISSFDFTDNMISGRNICDIDLRYNNISELPAESVQILVHVKSAVMNLRNNPLSCDCFTNEHLFRLLRDNPRLTGVGLGNYEYIRNITCASPERLVGVPFGQLKEEDIFCEEPLPVTFIVVVSSLGFLVILLAVIAFVVIRYRQEMTILLYTRCGILFRKLVREKKTFDAFISYSSLDNGWVINTLVKRLESKEKGPAFKLCVHHRDFEVGAAIADNVVKSVESSRHTVLVLSRNFTKSEWCIYEFRTAMHQSLIEKRRHMVIILLEDVPKENLESDLRKCLETYTYITVGDRLFWDKIIYSLSCGAAKLQSKSSSKS